MAAYLTLAEFRTRTVVPPEYVDSIEKVQPGWTLAQLESQSRWIDSRLNKRYATPFTTPVEAVKGWLARLVTLKVAVRRGDNPSGEYFGEIKEDAISAAKEIAEAADSNVGLFDLPLLDGASGTGISKGGPRVYSEQSPYVWMDGQGVTGRTEDSNRGGTRG